MRFGQERAARFGVFVHQHDPRPCPAGGQRGGQPRGPGAHHQHLAMEPATGVVVGIRHGRRPLQPGGSADEGLVDPVPDGPRPHEGLVPEAGGEQPGEPVVDRADIEAERGPPVLALGPEPVPDLLHRRPRVGLETFGAAALGAEKRVGLLGPCRDDAAGTVILEASADQVDAVGEQRRGHGVAAQSLDRLAVEGEADGVGMVHPALAGYAEPAHSAAPPPRRERGAAARPCRSSGTCRSPCRLRR